MFGFWELGSFRLSGVGRGADGLGFLEGGDLPCYCCLSSMRAREKGSNNE